MFVKKNAISKKSFLGEIMTRKKIEKEKFTELLATK